MSEKEIRSIHEIAECFTGYPFPSKQFLPPGHGKARVFRGDNLKEGYSEWGDKEKRWEQIAPDLHRYQLEAGDVLIGMDGSKVGKNWTMVQESDLPALLGQRVCRIRASELGNQEFLFHVFGSNFFRSYVDKVKTGTSIPHISIDQIREFCIAVPPYPEQKKIAEILSGIDRRIQADKSLLSKIEDTLQGLRDQTQFGKGRQVRIGDLVARITAGTSVGGENRPCNASEHGVLKVSCVSKGEFLPKENKVIVAENKERATMPVRRGMLLMSRANTPELVGACGITNSDYSNLYLPDKVWNLELADTAECSKEWLNNALNSQVGRSKIRDASTGTSDSMRNISQRNFLETEILVPPIATQKMQSDLIDSLLTKKRMTAVNLEKHQMLKAALSSDLLLGRKRVGV